MNQETYVGSTINLKKRFANHNAGKVFSTKKYKPWKLIYYEAFFEEKFARMREHNLKHNGNAIREVKKRIGLHKSGAGFTLIELLIVLGLLACLAASGMPLSMSMYRAYFFHSEYVNAVRLLEQARSLGHGLRFEEHKIIAFEGSYNPEAGSNIIFNQNVLIHSGNTEEIIFSPDSVSTSEKTIELTDGQKVKHIFINAAGRIEFE